MVTNVLRGVKHEGLFYTGHHEIYLPTNPVPKKKGWKNVGRCACRTKLSKLQLLTGNTDVLSYKTLYELELNGSKIRTFLIIGSQLNKDKSSVECVRSDTWAPG